MLKDRQLLWGDPAQSRRRLGCAINTGSTRLAELAARIGFDFIWIELEHASADWTTAEALCVAAEAGGAVPLIRTAGYRRDQVLPALEIGGRIIVAPLIDTPADARELVCYGKFRPVGQRGFNLRSRALGFGMDADAMARANAATWLLPQIETLAAIENLDDILAVPGLDGIFLGPGDLSADLGRPGRFDDPELRQLVCQAVAKARQRGLHAGLLAGQGPLLDAACEAGADLCVIGSDLKPLVDHWRAQLQSFAPNQKL